MSSNGRRKQTEAELLDTAWDLVTEYGAEVSIADIAKKAGVSRQTIYLHFGSRAGLLLALVRRADDRFDIKRLMFEAFAEPDPRGRLERTVQVWLDFVPKIYPVARDLIRLRDTDHDASAAWEDRMADLRSWLLVMFRSLSEEGALRDHWRAEDASDYFWAQSSVQAWGLLVHDCGWSEEAARDKIRRALVAALLRPDLI